MKRVKKLLLPLLAFILPSRNSYAAVQNQKINDVQDAIKLEEAEKNKTPVLYKFFSDENSIIKFIKHSSHRSHSSHKSHTSGTSGSSRKTYSSSSSNAYSQTEKEPDYNKDYDNPIYADKIYAYAYQDLNVRKEPNTSSVIVTSLKKGAKVKIESRKNSPWFKISIGEYVGYVNSKYLYYDN